LTRGLRGGGRLGHVARAALSLLLVSLAFHPADRPWLGWCGFVPWLLHLGRGGHRGLLPAVLVAYHLHFSILLGWVGEIAWPLVPLIPFLGWPFLVLLALGLDAGLLRARLPLVLAFPLAVVASEWLRDQALGLTWSSVGYTQWRWTAGIQSAALFRVHGLSFVVLTANAALATAILALSRHVPIRTALLSGVWALALLGGTAILGEARLAGGLERGPYAVGLQLNVPQWEKNQGHRLEHLARAGRLLAGRPDPGRPIDLLVFPETSWPRLGDPRPTLPEVLALPLPDGVPGVHRVRDLLPGAPGALAVVGYARGKHSPEGDEDGDGLGETNVAAVLLAGELVLESPKRRLVPFGEYVPWPRGWPLRAWLVRRIRSVGGFVPDMVPGRERPLARLAAGPRPTSFALSICFEIVYPEEFRIPVQAGADFLVNISNDGWYRESAELDLVQVATQFRAVECGRSLLRVSNTGISTLVDPRGRVLDLVESGGRRKSVAGLVAGEIPLAREATPWVRHGEWLPAVFPVLFVLLLAGSALRRRGA
jgi:apolipoprotein N-acyltransferase